MPSVCHPVGRIVVEPDDIGREVAAQAQRRNLELAAGGMEVVGGPPEPGSGWVVEITGPACVIVAGQVHCLDLGPQFRQPARLALKPDFLTETGLPDPPPGPDDGAARAVRDWQLSPGTETDSRHGDGGHPRIRQVLPKPRRVAGTTPPRQEQGP